MTSCTLCARPWPLRRSADRRTPPLLIVECPATQTKGWHLWNKQNAEQQLYCIVNFIPIFCSVMVSKNRLVTVTYSIQHIPVQGIVGAGGRSWVYIELLFMLKCFKFVCVSWRQTIGNSLSKACFFIMFSMISYSEVTKMYLLWVCRHRAAAEA